MLPLEWRELKFIDKLMTTELAGAGLEIQPWSRRVPLGFHYHATTHCQSRHTRTTKTTIQCESVIHTATEIASRQLKQKEEGDNVRLQAKSSTGRRFSYRIRVETTLPSASTPEL